jgi:hypothetical protein
MLKSNSTKIVFLALVSLIFITVSTLAKAGDDGTFVIHNKSAKNIVTGFYTNDNLDPETNEDNWSANWLADDLTPGTTANASFTAESGPCAQVFQAGWLGTDGSEVYDEPRTIDICKANNVYLDDNEIYYD